MHVKNQYHQYVNPLKSDFDLQAVSVIILIPSGCQNNPY